MGIFGYCRVPVGFLGYSSGIVEYLWVLLNTCEYFIGKLWLLRVVSACLLRFLCDIEE